MKLRPSKSSKSSIFILSLCSLDFSTFCSDSISKSSMSANSSRSSLISSFDSKSKSRFRIYEDLHEYTPNLESILNYLMSIQCTVV